MLPPPSGWTEEPASQGVEGEKCLLRGGMFVGVWGSDVRLKWDICCRDVRGLHTTAQIRRRLGLVSVVSVASVWSVHGGVVVAWWRIIRPDQPWLAAAARSSRGPSGARLSEGAATHTGMGHKHGR